ncbi:MAG: DUF4105 domain-containing protein [Pseudomonadota bacterium]|nr:DUF4105 domain-containing protein [Pseudomonadota bacterium]
MIKTLQLVTLTGLFLSAGIATGWAQPTDPAPDMLQNLAASNTWQRLLHYEPGYRAGSVISQVDDDDFFLAPDGKYEPLQELLATVAAMQQPVTTADQHAVCRFPARWKFLQQNAQLPAAVLEPSQCPEYSQWMNTLNPHSVSLVFASSYLNSPSSMYGHTFLRIDPADVETGSTWLSYAVNFGAELNNQDNSLLYAYKGLFGGYPGFFSVLRYYEKIQEYGRIENRDLWEYNLNLTPIETRAMVSHLWELRNVDFDYYFFDENCSYRLLELLEYARPDTSVRDDFGLRAIPVDTVRAVIDGGFLKSVHYRPAVATQLQHDLDRLTPAQQDLAWKLARRNIDTDADALLALPPKTRGQIFNAAYAYLRYLELDNPRRKINADYSLQLLRALNQLPVSPQSPPVPAVRPDQGHRTLLTGISGGQQDGNEFADLRLRLSYHDLTDNRAGYLDGAAINIGELRLRQRRGDGLRLEQLNLVDINSHSPRSQFIKPITWRVQAGLERIYGADDDDLAPQVHGGAGVTYNLGDTMLVYGMGMGRLEYNELLADNWSLGAGALAGALIYLPPGTLQLESQWYQFSGGGERYRHRLAQNFNLGRNQALRLLASHYQQVDTTIDEFSLEFRHYF